MIRGVKITVIASGIALAAMGSASARDLTVVSWGGSYQDAQRKAYFEPYQKATGNKLIEDSWDGGIGGIRAKVQGGAIPWDVVQVEAEELSIGCDEGLYVPIDWDKMGGKDKFLELGGSRLRRRSDPVVHRAGLRRRQVPRRRAAILGRLLGRRKVPRQTRAAQGAQV